MILVTGAMGQLGQCLKSTGLKAVFADSSQFNIVNRGTCEKFIEENNITTIINCAAYTQVDKAEDDLENADAINHIGVKNLAQLAKQFKCKLIHISTDYVFDGKGNTPYKTSDSTTPIGAYGKTKLAGELAIQNTCDTYAIIRTSWLYSEFAKNFVKSMNTYLPQKEEMGIVYDQVGSPTYAVDLAHAIVRIAEILSPENSGIYHYSNLGITSWYDLTVAIKELQGYECNLIPIETHEYPTPAKRPHYSVLDSKSLRETFKISIPYWRDSLKVCLKRID